MFTTEGLWEGTWWRRKLWWLERVFLLKFESIIHFVILLPLSCFVSCCCLTNNIVYFRVYDRRMSNGIWFVIRGLWREKKKKRTDFVNSKLIICLCDYFSFWCNVIYCLGKDLESCTLFNTRSEGHCELEGYFVFFNEILLGML